MEIAFTSVCIISEHTALTNESVWRFRHHTTGLKLLVRMHIFRIAFTVAACDSDCVTSNGSRILTNELERWGEDVGVVVCLNVLRGYLSNVIEWRQGTPQNSVQTKR
jgi:hypothetical protein